MGRYHPLQHAALGTYFQKYFTAPLKEAHFHMSTKPEQNNKHGNNNNMVQY
jgi:hypothetical protein